MSKRQLVDGRLVVDRLLGMDRRRDGVREFLQRLRAVQKGFPGRDLGSARGLTALTVMRRRHVARNNGERSALRSEGPAEPGAGGLAAS